MSNPKFTPGPWKVSRENKSRPLILTEDEMAPIGQVSILNLDEEANANLIAAAPDLYAALKEAVELWYVFDEPETRGGIWLAAARTAIAKATGLPAGKEAEAEKGS